MLNQPSKSIEDVARMLAREHVEDDPKTQAIYWAPHETEVRLVEVTSAVEDKGEVLPFGFTADGEDVPFPSVIVLLSPSDWSQRESLDWPKGFGLEDMKRIYPNGN